MAPKREKKRANLRDVARVAEVSVATVSRVLNSPDVVQKETRERVEKAISELGFHPSAAARAINSGRTKIIGALVPTLDSDIFALTIEAVENRLEDFGFSLVVATTGEDPDKEAKRAKELLDIGAEGLIMPGTTHCDALYDLIERTRVPAVVISYYDPAFRYPTIGYDNREAAALAMSHLLELGHRNIAVVHGPAQNNDRTRARVAGVATDRADVQLTFLETDLTIAGGTDAVKQASGESRVFDAFLCVSDVQAFGVLFELQRRGIAVPDDVSVMGLHDLPGSSSTFPSLSTIRLPAQKMGRLAAEGLAKWVESGTRPSPACLPNALMVRESTAPSRLKAKRK
ncbi:LacI family DNA-binding transcriptional regulator [Pacificoceanicola onchidii]|uniref:LacI family DNA-binding transcriptional regulator n=1 Tax=Pacificoceanicola onchidii TaxID=2562685 RepID=UPI0010A30000|nr:LacI family DNA-binding transcriptional regulator [Pacificoceanicola onchidii]